PKHEERERREVKAKRVGGKVVEEQTADHGSHAGKRPGLREPRRRLDPGLPFCSNNQPGAADDQADGDEPREPGRAEFLARHRRVALDVPEHDRAQRRERGAGQCIVDLYLANPTALSAEPRLASEAAMNFSAPAASAHTPPKPRLAMNSLYSFES